MTTTTPSDSSKGPLAPTSAEESTLWLAGLAVAVFGYLAVSARAVGGPADVAELRHLAVVGLLAFAALLATARGALCTLLPGLVTAWVVVLWVLPQGLLRSVAAGTVLTVSWVLCAVLAGRATLTSSQTLALAFGLQALERSDVLVTESGFKAAVILWVLPTVFAASLCRLQHRYGQAAVLAALLVVTVAGQISLAATLLFALAATTTIPSRRWAWISCLALGVVTIAWSPALGACLLLAALRLLDAPRWPAALMVAGGVLLAAAPVRDWHLSRDLSLLFLCAPLVWAGALAARRGLGPLAAAAGLAVVGLRYLEPGEALLAPALVLSLGAAALPALWRETQNLWSLALVGCGSLLANYPWHRDVSLDALTIDAWPLALALAVVLVAQQRFAALRNASLVLALLLLAAWPALRDREVLLGWPPQTLDAERSAWRADVPPTLRGAPLRVVIDSRLADARDLTTGSRCASLELLDQHGKVLVRWPLRSGLETAEWAADRDGTSRPASFSSTLDASGRFFGRTYRAAFVGGAPPEAVTLRLRRELDAANPAKLELHHVAIEAGRRERPRVPDDG